MCKKALGMDLVKCKGNMSKKTIKKGSIGEDKCAIRH